MKGWDDEFEYDDGAVCFEYCERDGQGKMQRFGTDGRGLGRYESWLRERMLRCVCA